MEIKVDIRDVLEANAVARAAMQSVTPAMRGIGKNAAAYSREHHDYKNQTGNAEAKTFAITENRGGTTYTLVTIAVPYASYLMEDGLKKRHASLTQLEDGIKEAETEFEFFFDGVEQQIGRL